MQIGAFSAAQRQENASALKVLFLFLYLIGARRHATPCSVTPAELLEASRGEVLLFAGAQAR